MTQAGDIDEHVPPPEQECPGDDEYQVEDFLRLNPVQQWREGIRPLGEVMRLSCQQLREVQAEIDELRKQEAYWKGCVTDLYHPYARDRREEDEAWDGEVPGYGRLVWNRGSESYKYKTPDVDSVVAELYALAERMQDSAAVNYGNELVGLIAKLKGRRTKVSSVEHLETRRSK